MMGNVHLLSDLILGQVLPEPRKTQPFFVASIVRYMVATVDAGVGRVVTCHGKLAGDSSGDNHNLHSLDLVNYNEADSLGLSFEMSEISDHSGSVDDIVQVELRDGGVHLLK